MAADPASPDPAVRGEYVFDAAGCAGCHTAEADDARPLAGGRVLETPFGVFYGPNITPDETHGIGAWEQADLRRALREGRSPAGHVYFPAFPYTSYTGMSDADIADLWAYLQTVEPVAQPNREHELRAPFGWRWLVPIWRLLYFDPAEAPEPSGDAPTPDRGAYLVEVLGHCGQCHTPRGLLGAMDEDAHLAGTDAGPEGGRIPNITPHPEAGIGDWSEGDIAFFLELGMMPDGDFAGGGMGEVISNSTSRLTEADRRAIAAYLLALPPIGPGAAN